MQLAGKIALVTGGGRGIGRGIVDRFLEEGAQVAVAQRRSLRDGLGAHPGVSHVHADLSVPSSTTTAVERTVERFGGIGVLVNNAGIMFERTVSDIRLDEWELMLTVNLRAPLFLAQAAVPHMRRRGGGSIINIGSIEGLAANLGHAAYCASEAGLHGMTRAMAVDLGVDGTRCNAIAPGWITSDLSEAHLASLPDPTEARDALNRLHPLARGAPHGRRRPRRVPRQQQVALLDRRDRGPRPWQDRTTASAVLTARRSGPASPPAPVSGDGSPRWSPAGTVGGRASRAGCGRGTPRASGHR